MNRFELIPDIGCIGLVGLLYKEDSEPIPELIANLDIDELDELQAIINKYLDDTKN